MICLRVFLFVTLLGNCAFVRAQGSSQCKLPESLFAQLGLRYPGYSVTNVSALRKARVIATKPTASNSPP